ncbi:MAG: hypothetical protein Q7U26_14055 [Aquabacterium sp.]|nr:hypothetical protein [Aquabacterium sp.]
MTVLPLSLPQRVLATLACSLMAACATTPTTGPMGFFVTSAGPGKGADLGGLSGADAHCQKLASAAGAGQRQWRAYLSTSAVGQDVPAVHARDRIGKGPWFNAQGALIARDVEQLHGANLITKATALDERGQAVKGRGDTPNQHDILTGSRIDGTAFSPIYNLTCNNWTASGDGQAMTGHHDRLGLVSDAWALSWNSSHQSRGCGQEALKSTGGAGLFYCFAAD